MGMEGGARTGRKERAGRTCGSAGEEGRKGVLE
jgi:hypothetical protein